MAVPSNTIQNVSRVGVREDLDNKIAELFPDDTPFINMIGRSTAKNTYTEWQTDGLAAASATNYTIQGDDLTNDSRANTVRVGTHTQISKKVVGSSTTVEATDKAGRRSELAREIMKAGRELRTDMEKRASGNYASVAAAAGTAGQTAGALAWLTTTSLLGTAGSPANGGFSAGHQRHPAHLHRNAAQDGASVDLGHRRQPAGGHHRWPAQAACGCVLRSGFGPPRNRQQEGDYRCRC